MHMYLYIYIYTYICTVSKGINICHLTEPASISQYWDNAVVFWGEES